MNRRYWIAAILGVLVVVGAVAVYRLPELVRRVAVARVHALTGRPVEIDRVELSLLRGWASIHGLRVAERDGRTPFAGVGRLDLRVRWLPLLAGRVRVRDVTLRDSTVHVVRMPDGTFNFADLVGDGGGAPGRVPDLTIDRFALTGGTVTLEDRALPEPRTWASEQITFEARDLSTRGDRGTATARSITAGAPVTISLSDVRLHPIQLRGTVTTEGLDLALARVYMPPGSAVVPARGRLSTTVTVALDARGGLRGDLTGRMDDVVLAPPDGGEALVRSPRITTQVTGFAFAKGALSLQRLALEGALSVRDPTIKQGDRHRPANLRASVADLTWPATTPGRLELVSSVPGGGTLSVTGTLRPPPEATDLRVRLAGVNLAPWAQFLPTVARVTGVAEADLRMNEPLAAGIPARVHGSVAVNRLAVSDDRREIFAARRIEASGIELRPIGETAAVHGPTRVVVKSVVVAGPRGLVERDASGAFRARDLIARPVSAAPARPAATTAAPPSRPIEVEVSEVVVRDGSVKWRDASVSPAAQLDVSAVDGRITAVSWPLRGPAGVRLAMRPPGGGRLQIDGRMRVDPLDADVRLIARGAELAPYRPYLPTTAHLAGAADLDLAVTVPSFADGRATARGRAALSRVDVRDGERTVMRVERAAASGIDVQWPERVAVDRVTLAQPWILVERDREGGLALRSLVAARNGGSAARPAAGACASPPCEPAASASAAPLAVTVAHLTVDGGGLRVVDQSVSPPFAVDLQSASATVDGLSTNAATPARFDVSGRMGAGSDLSLRGTLGALGGPLRLDVKGELREFALPRTNPYLLRQVGWKSTEGRVTSKLSCRLDGDALSAKTDITLSGLQVVRAAASDGAQARLGLPLGMITALLKNRRGDITVSLPVGGRLSDPRFDFSEAIWGAVRAVAVNAITLPVSWIGRVRFTSDSRIERIDVDPVAFEPGTPAPTAEGRAQVTRLAAFLDELPEVRLSLTPVVSSRDVQAMGRRSVESAVEQIARQHGMSHDAALARLFAERFPGQRAPEAPATAMAALAEMHAASPNEITELGAQRLEAVRGQLKRAGVDLERVPAGKLVRRDGRDGQVEADVIEPDTQRPSKVREVLRRLGLPGKDGSGEK